MTTNDIDLGIDGLSDYRPVGSGGFAETYAAFEADQDRNVAVKVLRSVDAGARRRFDRERRTMGTTTGHPHIVTLFRSGYTADDNPYLVMEYLAGGSFQDRLDQTGPLSLVDAKNAVAAVAAALGFSHSMGIVHKDVKPANILSSATGTTKLTDFGIAAIKESTVTSQLSFSMAYCPPEAFIATRDPETGAVIDARDERSDLYSLGATLYALVVGVPPYDGSQLTMLRQIADDPVPSTGHPALDRFLAIAMAKDPDDRHPDAASFLAGLQEIGSSLDVTAVVTPPTMPVTDLPLPAWPAPTPGASTGPVPGPADVVAAAASGTGSPAGRRWLGPALAGVVATLVVAVGAFSAGLVGGDDQPVEMASGPAVDGVTGDDAGSSTEEISAPATSSDTSGDEADTAVEADAPADDAPAADDGDRPPPRAPTPTPTPTTQYRYEGHADAVTSLAQLVDGRIVSGGPEGVLVWDPANPSPGPAKYREHTDVVLAIVSLANGRVASVAADEVRVWDPDGIADDLVFSRHDGAILTVAELADGTIASAGTDGVRVWDPEHPDDTTALYEGHRGAVLAVLGLPDGRIVSAGTDAVHVWHPDRPDRTAAVYEGHDGPILTLAALSDGRVASGGTDSTVQLWDPDNPGVTQLTYSGHNGGVASVVELSDRQIASAGPDTTVQVWETTAAFTTATFREHGEPVYRVLALPGGWVASAGEDRVVHIWDPADQGP